MIDVVLCELEGVLVDTRSQRRIAMERLGRRLSHTDGVLSTIAGQSPGSLDALVAGPEEAGA